MPLPPRRRSVFRHNSGESTASSAASFTANELQDTAGQEPLSFYQRYFTRSVPVPAPDSVSVTTHTPSPLPAHSAEPHEKDDKKNVAPTPRVSVYAIDFVRKFSFLSLGSLVLFAFLAFLMVVVAVVVLAVHFTHHSAATKQIQTPISAATELQTAALNTATAGTFVTTTTTSQSLATSTSSSLGLHTSIVASITSASTFRPSVVASISSNLPVTTSVATSSSSPSSMGAMPSIDSLTYAYSTAPVRLAVLANFADPAIYYDANNAIWYAFGTNSAAGILSASANVQSVLNSANLQIATSTDYENWTLLPASADPLPRLGDWALRGTQKPNYNDAGNAIMNQANVWAPEVLQHPTSGQWLMYYSAAVSGSPAHCIGAAIAASPTGPYAPLDTVLACPTANGGAIDASAFVEPINGTIYIAYKVDGNAKGNGGECGNSVAPIHATPIMLQAMAADGVTPDSAHAPFQLLDRTDADGPLIEAPSLVKVAAIYYLFYSSGCTRNNDYNVKYATATSLYGPYTRAAKPLLSTGNFGLTAPGSVTVRYAGGTATSNSATTGWKIALHGRVSTSAGGIRPFFAAGLAFDVVKRTVSVVAG